MQNVNEATASRGGSSAGGNDSDAGQVSASSINSAGVQASQADSSDSHRVWPIILAALGGTCAVMPQVHPSRAHVLTAMPLQLV